MTNTTTPETGISRGTRPTGKKRTGRVVALTGTAALAVAGITAAAFLAFAAPTSAPGAAAAPTTITKISKHVTTTGSGDSNGSNSGGGQHSGGHSSHSTGTPTQQEILRWQTDLSKLDYYDGPLDGVMSAETHNSIRLLQADAELTETGDMNAATRTAMQYMLDHQTDHHSNNGGGTHTSGNNSGGGTSHSTTPPSQQILHWQKDLTTLSYYDGDLDGVMSPEMQQSIRLLQGDAGLPQTGNMDAPTQAAMQKMLHTQS